MTRNMPVAPGLIPKRARRTAKKLVTRKLFENAPNRPHGACLNGE
jgi:hypothetical protein